MADSDLPRNIQAAVTAALAPQSAGQNEAYRYLEKVKENSPETWSAALSVFLDVHNSQPEARMYSLQILDDFLQRPTLQQNDLLTLRSSLFNHVQSVFRESSSSSVPSDPHYLVNAFARTLFHLFLRTYTDLWPEFLSDFSNLARGNSNSPDSIDLVALDLYLRFLHEISSQISDSFIRAARTNARVQRDSELRDALREKHASLVANDLFGVIDLALNNFANHQPPPPPGKADAIASESLKVIAEYVGWIDINYVVSAQTLPILQRCLSHSNIQVVRATLEALTETAYKGMPADDKIKLVQLLDPINLVNQLITLSEHRTSVEGNIEQGEQLLEGTGKFLNAVGIEVTRIPDETLASDEAKTTAYSIAQSLRPFILRLLDGTKSNEIGVTIFPFINSLLSVYKKERKRLAPLATLSLEIVEYLGQLLRLVIKKMKFTSEEEVPGTEEEDEEAIAAFANLRKDLKIIADSVAALDDNTYTYIVQQEIVSVLDSLSNNPSSLSWKDAELALYLLFCYGEALKAFGTSAFVLVPSKDQGKLKQYDNKVDYTQYPLSPLGDIILRVVKSPISEFPHPSVLLMYFESVVRYHDIFQLAPECIPIVLSVFLDHRGLHNSSSHVRSRASYLFYRYVYLSRNSIQIHVSAEFVGSILNALQDLLEVKVEVTDQDMADGGDILTRLTHAPSPFDSQLNLFEAIGTLIAILNQVPNEQESLLKTIITPLVERLKACVVTQLATVEDVKSIIALHHYILAIGHIAKGFPDLAMRVTSPRGTWVQVFKDATTTILECTRVMSNFIIVREAAISAFKIVVSTTGETVLPLIPTVIDCSLYQLTAPELVDFLPFLTLLLNKYKSAFTPFFDVLIVPVMSRIDHFLQNPVTGTDDAVQHSDLRRAYFNLLISVFSAGQYSILVSERNKQHLVSVFRSISQYIHTSDPFAADQKYGYIVLTRFIQAWLPKLDGAPPAPPSSNSNGHGQIVKALEPIQELVSPVYDDALKMALRRPLQAEFNFNDSSIFQMLAEIAIMVKAIHFKRGNELLTYLKEVLVPTLNAPPELADAFINAIATSSDGKQLKKPFTEFYQTMESLGAKSQPKPVNPS